LNNTTGTIGVVRLTLGGTVESHLTTTVATQPISGTVSLGLSNSTQPISGSVTLTTSNATQPVSFATTSTIGAAVTWAVGSTVNVAWTTTSTVPVSFATTSTLGAAVSCAANQTGTLVVRPWGTIEAGTVVPKREFYSNTLFSSTVVAKSGTISSSSFNISSYETKTISYYVSAWNNNSTILIEVQPVYASTVGGFADFGTWLVYYKTNVGSTEFSSKSFTETFNFARVTFVSGTTSSTFDGWLTCLT